VIEPARQEAHCYIVKEFFFLKEFRSEETLVLEEDICENEITHHFLNDFLRKCIKIATVFEIVHSIIRIEILHIHCDVVN
jgi:hypothetical protein